MKEKLMQKNLNEVILEALNEVACDDTGQCQVNFQAESARIIIANKIAPQIEKFIESKVQDAVEMVVCCGGNYHE